jgi:hypothetical protein
MSSHSKKAALTRAEETFERAQNASRKAREADAQDILEKTARLGALRLAKEAADTEALKKEARD